MTDILLGLVSQAERNVFPALSRLSEDDVENIWTNVSSFIERQMSVQKAVCISGLGTFTFSQQKLDVGHKYIFIQRPAFLLSEKLCQSYGLKQNKACAIVTDIPVVPLNFAALSVESPFERDVVEGCIRETLLLLLRAVSAQHTVHLTFRGIGVLFFRHGSVKMKFYRDFITAMDGTGRLLWAMWNLACQTLQRPGTSISIVSETSSSLQRPVTSNVIMLPTISLGKSQKVDKDKSVTISADSHSWQEDHGTNACVVETMHPAQCPLTSKTNAVDLREDRETKDPQDTFDRCAQPCKPPEGDDVQETAKEGDGCSNLPCTDHNQYGQELCCLCMQRAQRNVPLYLAEERQREEREQAKVLMLAEHEQVKQALQREQVERDQKREYNKKVAAFNLGAAHALKEMKTASPSQFEGSYILTGRPITPPRLLKQRRYMHDLTEMVDWRKQQETQKREKQQLIERLQQVQLTEEQTKHRTQELHQKNQNIKNLQKALDTQLVNRATPIPALQPDSEGPVFGARAGTPLMMVERRQRMKKIHHQNMCTATSRRQDELLHHLSQQKKERDMLQCSNKELISDRVTRYKKLRKLQASLEDTWNRSIDLKHQRDLEEEVFIRSGARLLLDQCEQYRRCYQCKRKTSNRGDTNIWKESRYIPGARLML